MTYASRLRAKTDYRHPCNRSFPGTPPVGQEALDRIAEAKFKKDLLGGFSKNRVCPGCRVALPKTNHCDECGFNPARIEDQ